MSLPFLVSKSWLIILRKFYYEDSRMVFEEKHSENQGEIMLPLVAATAALRLPVKAALLPYKVPSFFVPSNAVPSFTSADNGAL